MKLVLYVHVIYFKFREGIAARIKIWIVTNVHSQTWITNRIRSSSISLKAIDYIETNELCLREIDIHLFTQQIIYGTCTLYNFNGVSDCAYIIL